MDDRATREAGIPGERPGRATRGRGQANSVQRQRHSYLEGPDVPAGLRNQSPNPCGSPDRARLVSRAAESPAALPDDISIPADEQEGEFGLDLIARSGQSLCRSVPVEDSSFRFRTTPAIGNPNAHPNEDVSSIVQGRTERFDEDRHLSPGNDSIIAASDVIVVQPTEEPPLCRFLFSGRPWLAKHDVAALAYFEPIQLLLHTLPTGMNRFLAYDEWKNAIFFLADTLTEAAEAWKFPDLTKWKMVDNATGVVLDFRAYDPEVDREVTEKVEDVLGLPRGSCSSPR